ncbi:MAG TPA: lantibiotic dehydratase C-terminal domain-containing protein [Longimicrobium sp.]|nr:lantibiotic dehydratase C-terminal domain-containing protein [Longimicrobium sp.]
MHAPDPILTASIFCNRRLDRVVHQGVAPALERLRAERPEADWGVWWVRYAANGDHLKARVHGPAERADDARRVLEAAVEALFASLPPADPEEARFRREGIPAIDPEDEASEDYPDRSLLWTRYRRSHVSLGPKALLRDDAYAARITACLTGGAALVLESTSLDAEGRIPGAARQRAVLRALFAGLRAAGFGAAERAEYLAYHRDWLVRFAAADEAGEDHVRNGFDRQVARVEATVQQLARTAAAHWGPSSAPAGDATDARWRGAIAELSDWSEVLRAQPSLDPYTERRAFPLVFKALHAVANQAGLDLVNEAFLYHLVGRAARVAERAAEPEPEPEPAAEAYA